jgi:hypothetical protein
MVARFYARPNPGPARAGVLRANNVSRRIFNTADAISQRPGTRPERNISIHLSRYFSRNTNAINKTAKISRYTFDELASLLRVRPWYRHPSGRPGWTC